LGKKSFYLKTDDWSESFDNKLYRAIVKASKEVAGGIEIKQLKALINRDPKATRSVIALNIKL